MISKIWKEFIDFIKENKLLVVLLIIVLILSFGYTLTNYSIGIDDTAFDRYMDGTELLAQERFSAPLLQKILGIYKFAPFWIDGVAVIFLFISIILWCVLFKKVSNNKMNKVSYIVFATIFASYPLINEIFIYMTASLSICISYALTVISLLIMNEYLNRNNYSYIIISSIIMCFAISFYESFAAVYLLGCFCILILSYFYSDIKKGFIDIFKRLITIILPLIFGILLKSIISNSLIFLLSLQKSPRGLRQIAWMSVPFISNLKRLIKDIFENYFIASASYLPILIYVIATIICLFLAIYSAVKYKSNKLLLLFFGLYLCTVSLAIVQGTISPYRTCQVFAVFIAFIFMLFNEVVSKKKIMRVIALILIFIMVLKQSEDLSQWFYLDSLRFQQDKYIAYSLGYELNKNYDMTKPVVFIGYPKVSKYISDYRSINKNSIVRKAQDAMISILPSKSKSFISERMDNRFNETNSNNLFAAWGVDAFMEPFHKPNIELLKFFDICGFSLVEGNLEQYNKAYIISDKMPSWPKEGSIKDEGTFIIVNFGK